MGRIPEKLLKKIEKNIEKIGEDLRDFPGVKMGTILRIKIEPSK